MSEQFHVFLCHNSQDKPEVEKIARQLQQQGLKPWLDEWQLRPGLSWQELLEEQIEDVKSAAVFVGSSGFGPWQEREMRAFLSEFVDRKCPVIPVLLSNAPQKPKLPIFLKAMTWVDFRRSESESIERLIWGITGKKPGVSNPSQLPARVAVTSNSPFKLKGEDGRYIGAAEFGDSPKLLVRSLGQRAYWPRLKGDAVAFRIVNQKQLENDQIVKISTDEQFRPKWTKYNLLGAFSMGVYYWNDYGSKSNWRIARLDDSSPTQVHFGDRVCLWNEEYQQYLAPRDDDYLTTGDNSYAWMIERA